MKTLNVCVGLAEKFGLSKMTMEEITNEVKAVRKKQKNRGRKNNRQRNK